MADRNDRRAAADAQWRDAFAAVAPEAPPAQAWERVAAALGAEPSASRPLAHRFARRRRIVYALAATLALAAIGPIALRLGSAPDGMPETRALASHPGVAIGPARGSNATTGPDGGTTAAPASVQTANARTHPGLARDPGAAGGPIERAMSPVRRMADAPSTRVGNAAQRSAGIGSTQSGATSAPPTTATSPRVVAVPHDAGMSTGDPHMADAQPAQPHERTHRTRARSMHASTNAAARNANANAAASNSAASDRANPAAAPASLGALYARSAQLEQLVALSRNDRVASGSGSVIADTLGERIARIDDALAQPGLAPADQAALWQERVSTLGQLAGITSTERWLAANGETFSTALVRVD